MPIAKASTWVVATLMALLSAHAKAFDGWHVESAVAVPGKASGWDYLAIDEPRNHLFVGHRKEGLKVIDLRTQKLIKVLPQTEAASSNGATLMPEFDLGVSNNQNGSLTPFKLSSLETNPDLKLGGGLDNSHYDPVTKRLVVTMDSEDGKGTELLVLQAPELSVVGRVRLPSDKPEHADFDGQGAMFIAARDVDKVFRIDLRRMQVSATWSTPGCGQTNSLAMDVVNARIFLGCRGRGAVKPSFAVMDASNGSIIYTAEIGAGNDGLIYDRDLKRIFLSNGVQALINVFEQIDANVYKPTEAMGTRANVRTIAMDSRSKKIYSFTAEGSADFSKPVLTSVSPFYANTFFANTFTLLTIARKP